MVHHQAVVVVLLSTGLLRVTRSSFVLVVGPASTLKPRMTTLNRDLANGRTAKDVAHGPSRLQQV